MVVAAWWPTSAVPAVLNVPVAARVISFTQPAPSGVVPIAIIYQPGNSASENEAADIERSLSGGLTFGNATLRGRRIAVTNLSQLGGRVAFITSGLHAYHDEIAAVASAQSVLTITSDLGCVTSNRCVVSISGGAKTQIIVSKAAMRRHNIRFGSAFLMLVKEI